MRLSLAALLLSFSDLVSGIPEGFEDRAVITEGNGLLVPTDFVFTPQGQMLVVNKGGQLNVFDDPNGDNSYSVRSEALDLSPYMCANGERGIQGLGIHPDFGNSNRYIYIFYTFNKFGSCPEDPFTGPVNRLSRFVLQESNTVDIGSETVFFETSPLEFDHHNSGDIAFGNDGNLWVTVGDGGSTWSGVSANPGLLLGSMVRLTPDGGIPTDNPFTPQSGEANSVRCNVNGTPPPGSPAGAKCQEIFALGLRNPFRFAIDPNVKDKVRFHVNDVGQGLWEEVNIGGTDYAAANYGWPAREGPCPNNKRTGCADDHPYLDPIHYYEHNNGGAVTGAAFVPAGVWPDEYTGLYLYADFVFGTINLMQDSGDPECRTCDPPVSNKQITEFTQWYQVANMGFGPYGDTQALYYSGVFDIRRVVYVGDGNRSPNAVILAEPTSGQVGVTVMFSGAGSNDPDNDGLTFEWDFDGDGVIDSNEPDTSYTYSAAGLYKAALTVNDGNGGSHTVTIDISVGNKPVPNIISPAPGSTFAVGDVFTLTGEATDVEDGSLEGMTLTWEVRQHHDTHYHPFLLPTEGNNIELQPAPEPEDYAAATNSYLEIILTATDSDGLSDTVNIEVQPRLVPVEFDTVPSGLQLFLDGTSLATPATATTWENHNLKVDAPDQLFGGQGYVWASWSDGAGDKSRVIQIPPASDTTPKYVATFDEFFGTFPPSGTPGAGAGQTCDYASLGIVAWQSELVQGQTYVNAQAGVYTEQMNTGNLVVRKGTPTDPGDVIWESGYVGEVGNYYTRLIGNSNMATFKGTPPDGDLGFLPEGVEIVWEIGTLDVDWDGNYAFVLHCSGTVVAVIQGTVDDPRSVVWQSAPFPGPGTGPNPAPTGNVPAPSAVPIAPSPAPECTPGSLGIVAWQWELAEGQVFINIDFEVYTFQEPDGNLVVRRGTPDNPGDILWESGFHGEEGQYFTRVLGNSNMITYKGVQPEAIEDEVWQSGTEMEEGLYFFGITCNGTTVVVTEGTPEDPGDIVWQGAPYAEPASPTMAPSVGTAAPASAPPTTAAPSVVSSTSGPTSETATSSPTAQGDTSTSDTSTMGPTASGDTSTPAPTASSSADSSSWAQPTSTNVPAPTPGLRPSGSGVESTLPPSSGFSMNTAIGLLFPLGVIVWLH